MRPHALLVLPAALAVCSLACAGCAPAAAAGSVGDDAGDGSVQAVSDIELDLAALALVDDGPFRAVEGDAVVGCVDGGVALEAGRAEVRTEWCDPADLAGALPRDVRAGERVAITLSHDVLVADGGAAHLSLVIGDEVVWELSKPLPAPAAFIAEGAALARAHARGERVVVHVHNHGANSYAIHRVAIGAAP